MDAVANYVLSLQARPKYKAEVLNDGMRSFAKKMTLFNWVQTLNTSHLVMADCQLR